MSNTNQARSHVTSEFRESVVHDCAEFRKHIAIDLKKYNPKNKEDFAVVIQSALRAGIKIKDIVEMAMTPAYNVKRWMKGTHCPPMLVRKTVTDGVSKSLQNSGTEAPNLGFIVADLE